MNKLTKLKLLNNLIIPLLCVDIIGNAGRNFDIFQIKKQKYRPECSQPGSDRLDVSANCQTDLSPETTLSASSSYDPLNVGPAQARLNHDEAGGAWCPELPVGPQGGDQWLGLNTSTTRRRGGKPIN